MIRFKRDLDAIARIDAVPMLLDVICRSTGMGFAAVARVTEERWIACAVDDKIAFGLLPGDELKIETTICDAIRVSGEPVIIDHVATDAEFSSHPTPAMYGFQSYISMPILRRDGTFFGTLCAIDPKPAKLRTPETIGMFRLFADLIGFHLEAQEKLDASEAALLTERQTADLREQFIAVLGHDLRNPIAAIDAGLRMLGKSRTEQQAQTILSHMGQSVRRVDELIANVLDLARGRLGGGIGLNRTANASLKPMLEHTVDELRASWPNRTVNVDIDLPVPIDCDGPRISQLLSNLVGNALTHGTDAPIWVVGSVRGSNFELSVANDGKPIPAATRERLFEPFNRAAINPGHAGLGLGLFIAAQIARAHGGTLTVASVAEETRFTLTIPLTPAATQNLMP